MGKEVEQEREADSVEDVVEKNLCGWVMIHVGIGTGIWFEYLVMDG